MWDPAWGYDKGWMHFTFLDGQYSDNPQGYVTLMFGGPIGPAQKGIVGAIDENGVATEFLLPSETRAAARMALGIWPFEPEAFAVSDLLDVATDAQAVKRLREVVLGVP